MAATTEFDVSNHGREQRVDERICSAFQLPEFTERGVDHERIAALDAGGAQLLEEHGGHATRSIVSCLMSAIRTETQCVGETAVPPRSIHTRGTCSSRSLRVPGFVPAFSRCASEKSLDL